MITSLGGFLDIDNLKLIHLSSANTPASHAGPVGVRCRTLRVGAAAPAGRGARERARFIAGP